MDDKILTAVDGVIQASNFLKTDTSLAFIKKAALMIADCFEKGGKIIIAGNGGSLCDAMHFAEEFTAFFREKRKALPAIVLSEAGHLTAVSNDTEYNYVFERGVEAFLKKGDIFIALTTSGNSLNLINAIKKAKILEGKTISFLGKTGGDTKGLSDLEIIVEGFKTSDRIQEAHMAMIHIIIEMVEYVLFEPQTILKKLTKSDFAKSL
ncbi:MAG: SIS domain-containing protein [Parachlamydiales bacterium]|nr:SIS domain-containing protein [Parachlamydiales bacterium]